MKLCSTVCILFAGWYFIFADNSSLQVGPFKDRFHCEVARQVARDTWGKPFKWEPMTGCFSDGLKNAKDYQQEDRD